MDILNVQPDALGTPDTTTEIEGYDDQIEQIEQAYPEEDFRTPAEQAAEEQVAQPEQAAEEPVAQPEQPQAEGQPKTGVEGAIDAVASVSDWQTQDQINEQKAAEKEKARLERTKHLTQRQYGEDGLATS